MFTVASTTSEPALKYKYISKICVNSLQDGA